MAQENRRPLQLIIVPAFAGMTILLTIDYFSEFSVPSIDFAQDGVCGPESVLIRGLASFGCGFKGGTEGAV